MPLLGGRFALRGRRVRGGRVECRFVVVRRVRRLALQQLLEIAVEPHRGCAQGRCTMTATAERAHLGRQRARLDRCDTVVASRPGHSVTASQRVAHRRWCRLERRMPAGGTPPPRSLGRTTIAPRRRSGRRCRRTEPVNHHPDRVNLQPKRGHDQRRLDRSSIYREHTWWHRSFVQTSVQTPVKALTRRRFLDRGPVVHGVPAAHCCPSTSPLGFRLTSSGTTGHG